MSVTENLKMASLNRLALIGGVAVSLASPALASELHLSCAGGGSHRQESSSFAFAKNKYGGTAYGQAVHVEHAVYEDEVSIDIVDDRGRIRLPRALLPALHGGDNAWFEMTKLVQTDGEITASANVNVVTHPKIRLDRYTGMLSIDGRMGTFTAQCQRVDEGQERAF